MIWRAPRLSQPPLLSVGLKQPQGSLAASSGPVLRVYDGSRLLLSNGEGTLSERAKDKWTWHNIERAIEVSVSLGEARECLQHYHYEFIIHNDKLLQTMRCPSE